MTVVQVPMLNSGAAVVAGAGSPIGTIALGAGSLYLRTDVGSLWLNPTDGNNAWIEIGPDFTGPVRIIPGPVIIGPVGTVDLGAGPLEITNSTRTRSINISGTVGNNVSNTHWNILIDARAKRQTTFQHRGIAINVGTEAAAFTCTNLTAYYAFNPANSLGAGSSIGNYAGFNQDGISITSLTNYAFVSGPVNGGTVNNYGLFLNDVTGTGAFAIKTGLGTVDLGDLLITTASVSGGAKFRLPHGTAPSSPVDGDVWTTTSGLFVRINGVTVGPLT